MMSDTIKISGYNKSSIDRYIQHYVTYTTKLEVYTTPCRI